MSIGIEAARKFTKLVFQRTDVVIGRMMYASIEPGRTAPSPILWDRFKSAIFWS